MSASSWFCALVAAGFSAAAHPEPALVVPDAPVIEGDRIDMAVTGLEPGQRIRFIAERGDLYRQGWRFRSQAVFEATAWGVVDPARHAPVSGDWTRADPFAFLWTMEALRDQAPPPGVDRRNLRISADIDMDGRVDLSARLAFKAGGFSETDASELSPGAFLLRPDGPGPHPAVIVMGGSEGGDNFARVMGPGLAQRGFAVLGLPYYSPVYPGRGAQFPQLPSQFVEMPLELTQAGHDWLAARPGVNPDAIALMGLSKGAEMVLAAAAYIGGFEAVAAIVPSDVIWEGFTPEGGAGRSSFALRGEPLAFIPYEGLGETFAAREAGEDVLVRTPHMRGRAANPERVAPARIPVERIAAPVLVLGGLADEIWPSGEMALAIMEARRSAGSPVESLVYVDAGHGLSRMPSFPMPAAEAQAMGEAYPALVDFLDAALRE